MNEKEIITIKYNGDGSEYVLKYGLEELGRFETEHEAINFFKGTEYHDKKRTISIVKIAINTWRLLN